jgi:hypothetical protein
MPLLRLVRPVVEEALGAVVSGATALREQIRHPDVEELGDLGRDPLDGKGIAPEHAARPRHALTGDRAKEGAMQALQQVGTAPALTVRLGRRQLRRCLAR